MAVGRGSAGKSWWGRGIGVVASLSAALVVALAAEGARAAGAIGFESWDGSVSEPSLQPGDAVAATGASGLASSMAGNPFLNGSAWAHTGAWWKLYLSDSPLVTLRVEAYDAAQFAPGLSVWASGSAAFDGGTTGYGGEVSSAGFGTPHSFNAYAPLGSPGTLWMQAGQGGNMQELVGYAISGPSYAGTTGWGETIAHGAWDTSLGNAFVGGVSGSVGAGFAELVLSEVQAGWFTIYVGGTDHSLAGGQFDLSVSSVPEPATALLLGLGLLGIVAYGRRH